MRSTPPALKERFLALVARVRGAEPRAMFGQVGAMVGERMFAGTFEEQIVLRLSGPERELFVRAFGGVTFEPMPGRAMRDYVSADADVLHDDTTLLAWMRRAAAHTRALPPKAAKAGASRKAGGPAARAAVTPAAPSSRRSKAQASKPAPRRGAPAGPRPVRKAASKKAATSRRKGR